MAIKFAEDIIKEIEERGSITVPRGYVTGEAFEEWLYEDIAMEANGINSLCELMITARICENEYNESYGEAA